MQALLPKEKTRIWNSWTGHFLQQYFDLFNSSKRKFATIEIYW